MYVKEPQRRHRTQAERSEQTRAALLDATIDCLIELGYARTSVQEICARAGVSKGAQQHHFSTKAELMASAVEHLTHRITDQMLTTGDSVPRGQDLLDRGVDHIWEGFSGTLAAAFMELWVAARTDPELAAAMRPVDRALGRATLVTFRKLAGEQYSERAEALYWLTVNLVRGLALDASIGGDPARQAHLLKEWKRIARATLNGS